jgi:hypothetical protein
VVLGMIKAYARHTGHAEPDDRERKELSMEVLLTDEDWSLIRQSLRATIRHRETTDDYLDDHAFRAAQVEAAKETLRRVEALHEQLAEEV